MKDFKTIVVPIDGSQHAMTALDYAVSLAQTYHAILVLVHVIDLNIHMTPLEQVTSTGPNLVPEELKTGGLKLLAAARRQIPLELRSESILETGVPAERILLITRAKKADLIVMGSRGLSPLKQIFLGSVSQQLLDHAACPVMLVRGQVTE